MYFKPEYILILLFTIVIDYGAGIFIENTHDKGKKKWFLIASLCANIGVLAVFKYFNFINDNITGLMKLFGGENHIPALKILLPIGLSFHTFQAMSYTFEVYRGKQKAERHFGIYSLYVMFYPQLVAGPIERPQNILHQFYEKKQFNYENAIAGLNLIVLGLFKKVVVADRLAVYVNQVYTDPGSYGSLPVLLAAVFFSFQIYCDFSGYSDIARGTARFMGYELMINFNRPYAAVSIADFWSRWHISLSTWFRDYLYIPLGGNRGTKIQWYRNLLIVFLISGLWHGANWTFIVWGGLHAFYLLFGLLTQKLRHKVGGGILSADASAFSKLLNQLLVFALVTFAWIFFRAKNMNEAEMIISRIFSFDFSFNLIQLSAEKGPLNLILSFLVLLLLGIVSRLSGTLNFRSFNTNFAFLFSLIFLIVFLGKDGTGEFIYFQF